MSAPEPISDADRAELLSRVEDQASTWVEIRIRALDARLTQAEARADKWAEEAARKGTELFAETQRREEAERRLDDAIRWIYPHMCRMDHPEVGYKTEDEVCPVCKTENERDAAIARAERAEKHLASVRSMLRIECDAVQASEWSDDLHLADVVEKHLCRKLHYDLDAADAENRRLRAALEAAKARIQCKCWDNVMSVPRKCIHCEISDALAGQAGED